MAGVFWGELSRAVFRGDAPAPATTQDGRLPGPLPVSALLAESAGLAGAALARLRGDDPGRAGVDGRRCSMWASTSGEPVGWTPPSIPPSSGFP